MSKQLEVSGVSKHDERRGARGLIREENSPFEIRAGLPKPPPPIFAQDLFRLLLPPGRCVCLLREEFAQIPSSELFLTKCNSFNCFSWWRTERLLLLWLFNLSTKCCIQLETVALWFFTPDNQTWYVLGKQNAMLNAAAWLNCDWPHCKYFSKAPPPSSSPLLAPNTSVSFVHTHVQTQSTTTHNCKREAHHFIIVRRDKNLLLLHCHQTKRGGKKRAAKVQPVANIYKMHADEKLRGFSGNNYQPYL